MQAVQAHNLTWLFHLQLLIGNIYIIRIFKIEI